MESTIKIALRAIPVRVKDQRTGTITEDIIVLDKKRLQAAELCGIGCKGMIFNSYSRKGFKVLEVGEAVKRNVTLNLKTLYDMAGLGVDMTAGVKSYLEAYGVDDRSDRSYWLGMDKTGTVYVCESSDAGGSIVLDSRRPGGDPCAE